ncbi:exodeoxyribonuclease VII large subunit [Hyphococcus luteus]|uniref:Exodeoxyribonuclease 7 large subunit n=1 Tax=Hyphococcus luteus TaxID=2058213 RepID=A0A2S7K3K0_9PROT|nr:exodeoxyribonuclease VII large subunit [Marinicaulis flavus]PQA87080.1 exodeoxyribonuclease VII large subunit [Marinicaulis flavus]
MSEKNIGNLREYTVSELSGAVKRTIEDTFGLVRVKGELGRVTRAASGHVYLDLKDEKAVISGVMWKGMAARLAIKPEQGMEVVATGRMSTFPGQSRYQLIIDSLEPAGVGALMALFEERKKKLAAEGLFAPERKRPLPFLPKVIGVVTSPSGAVIRDILHRLRERFPRHVIVWPTLVQGRGAEEKIVEAIRGFNALRPGGDIPRPDVLIVARGGGSLEDLWCFNEEMVARAAAASEIPLISAVGHETDTTLIDYASDKRAPTPTAAAEFAVPVRAELLAEVLNKERRFTGAVTRMFETRRSALVSAARGLGRPEDILGAATQRLDRASDRLRSGLRGRLDTALTALARASGRLTPGLLAAGFGQREHKIGVLWSRIETRTERIVADRGSRLQASARMLAAVSYESVLERGFALVRAKDGTLLRRAGDAAEGAGGEIQFADGVRAVHFDGAAPSKSPKSPAKSASQKETPKPDEAGKPRQPRLFD